MKEGWKMVKLKDISENLDYKRIPITKGLRTIGKFPYYGASGIVDYVSDYIFDDNLLLISEDGANLLARTTPIAFSVSGKIWVNNHAHVLKFQNLCTQKIVEYFIAGFNITPYVTGMAQPKLNQKSLDKIEIPLPPLEEQHRIVSILDASFEKIDALKKNAEENLKNAKALFQQVLAQELQPKEGWVEKKLGEICKIKGGKRLPKGESISVEPTPYKYIRVADFRDNGTVIVDDVLYINETTYKQISQYTISSKDVYISIAGTIGKTGIIPEELEGANLTENACKLVLGNMINKRFLYYNTLSQYFKEQIKKGTKITAQPKLALNRLSEIIIPFPTDIDQQRKIVSTLDTLGEKCRRLEQVAQQTIRECDALKQSILRQAFSGEL